MSTETHEQFFAGYRTAFDAEYNKVGWRNAVRATNDKGKMYATSLDEARQALRDIIKRQNKGAMVETHRVGDFGVDVVVDADTARSMTVVQVVIKKRTVTEWEEVEENYGL